MDVTQQMLTALRTGELVLLFIVLSAIGVFLRQWILRQQQFMEKIADDAILARKEFLDALNTLNDSFSIHREAESANSEKIAACLERVSDDMQRESTTRKKEHDDMNTRLEKVLNGRRKAAEAQVEKLTRQSREGAK